MYSLERIREDLERFVNREEFTFYLSVAVDFNW